MRCADAQNLASSHASLPDWRGSQGNKLMRETNQDFTAWIESEKMAEKKIKKVSASAASRWVLELDVKKQWLNYKDSLVYCLSTNVSLVLLMSHYECNDIKSKWWVNKVMSC